MCVLGEGLWGYFPLFPSPNFNYPIKEQNQALHTWSPTAAKVRKQEQALSYGMCWGKSTTPSYTAQQTQLLNTPASLSPPIAKLALSTKPSWLTAWATCLLLDPPEHAVGAAGLSVPDCNRCQTPVVLVLVSALARRNWVSFPQQHLQALSWALSSSAEWA